MIYSLIYIFEGEFGSFFKVIGKWINCLRCESTHFNEYFIWLRTGDKKQSDQVLTLIDTFFIQLFYIIYKGSAANFHHFQMKK